MVGAPLGRGVGASGVTVQVAIADELLTEAEVLRRVPGRDAAVRDWLRGLGIARRGPSGLRVYRWAEVLAALPLDAPPAPAAVAPTAPVTLRRSSRL